MVEEDAGAGGDGGVAVVEGAELAIPVEEGFGVSVLNGGVGVRVGGCWVAFFGWWWGFPVDGWVGFGEA